MSSGVRYSVFPIPGSSLQRQPSRGARSSSTERAQDRVSKPTVSTLEQLSNLKLDAQQEPVSSAPSDKSHVGTEQKAQPAGALSSAIDKGKAPSTQAQTEGVTKPQKPVVKLVTDSPDLCAPSSPEARGKSPAISVTDASSAIDSPESSGRTCRYSRFAKDPPLNVEGDTANVSQPQKRSRSTSRPGKPTVKLATSSPVLYGPAAGTLGKSPTASVTQPSPADPSPARSTSSKKATISPTKSILKNSDKHKQQHSRTDTEASRESIETANTIANIVPTADTTATSSKTHSASNSKSSSLKTTPVTPASSIDSCPSPWSAAAMSAFKSDPVKYPAVPATQSPHIPLPPLPKTSPPRRSASRSSSASTARNTSTTTGAGPGPVLKRSDSQAVGSSASVYAPHQTFLRSPSASLQSQADTTNSTITSESGPFQSIFPAYNPDIPLSKQNYRPNYNPSYYPSAPRNSSAPIPAATPNPKPLPADPPSTRTRPPLKQTTSQPQPQTDKQPPETPFFPAPPTRPTSDPPTTRPRNRIRKRAPSAVSKPAHSHKPRKSNTSVSAGSIGSKKSDGTTTSTTITTTMTRTRTIGRGGKDGDTAVDKAKPSFDGTTVVDGAGSDAEAGETTHQRRHAEAAAAGATGMPEQTHARHGASVALGAMAFVMGVGVEVMGGAVEGFRKKGGRKSGVAGDIADGKGGSVRGGKSGAGSGSQVAKVEKAKG